MQSTAMVPELSVRSSSGSASASVLRLLLAVQMVQIASCVDKMDNNVG